jgi:cell division protein FtsI/penicillin-binding protein 2
MTPVRAALLLVLSLAPELAAPALPATRRTSRSRPRTPSLPSVIIPPDGSERDRSVALAARSALGGSSGSVVALDPRNGRVIAVVNPTYALLNAYQPCSVFKLVVAVAGLSEGVITPESVYTCQRGCWAWPGHGVIDLRRALAVSCNPYFEWVGERLGYSKVQQYARLMGLGAPTGINLTGESSGVVPAQVAPDAVGHLSSHAEGIKTTALQLAVLIAATINGGTVYQPQLLPLEGFVAKERWRLPPETVLDALSEGYVSAVNEGSATNAFDPDVVVAGKTGSCSQAGWFASYAPADHPELVIVVFLRRGNGHLASAVAGRIYQELYKPPLLLPAAAGGQ